MPGLCGHPLFRAMNLKSKHALQLLFYAFYFLFYVTVSLKVRDHNSRSTLGPGPSKFGVQISDQPPT